MTTIDLSMFTIINDDGDTATAQRPESKSWDDVDQCILHNKGQPLAVIDRFIELATMTEQWKWFDLYNIWLADCETINELNDSLTNTETEPYPLPVMPGRPEIISVDDWKIKHYELFRKSAYGSAEHQFNVLYGGFDVWKSYRDSINSIWYEISLL